MKKLLLLSIFAIFLFTFAFSQEYGWTDISANMPEQVGFNDVHFTGNEGWITGGNDKVYYTPDGGTTFSIQQLPTGSGITSSVFMKNNQDGYVVTFNGKILKTDDGGTNWTMLHEPGGALNSVHFPPTLDKGYTCGSDGKIWTFDDFSIMNLFVEGLTATLLSIMFPEDSTEGKLCGDSSIRRWLDDTWNNLQIFDNRFVYNSIFFTDNNTGWVVGSQGKIFKTVDATIWNPQMTGTTKGLNDVFFIDSSEGWVVGSETLLRTVDGGETWAQELAGQTVGMELRAIYFTSAYNGYVVGNGVLLKYGEISGIGDGVLTLAFEVFPNPASSIVSIQSAIFSQQSALVEISDMHGRKLLEKKFPTGSGTIEIDASSLESGIYFCRLISENKSTTQKLIIQK